VLECLALARERAVSAGMTLVHPIDDPDVIAGQGTLGLELLEAVPDLAKVVVPVGGGGLASGVAIAVKSARPEVEVVGVQVESCAAFADSLRGGESPRPLTIADGIAIKRPGRVTLPLAKKWLDGVVTVGEDQIAEAMVLLLERAKQVVEGAGAVGVAALMVGSTAPADEGTTVAILSGGNVDAGLLAEVARRHETEMGRRLLVQSRIGDRPGSLARLLGVVGDEAANLIEVQHVREGLDLHVRETAVQMTLETRGREHARAVLEAIREAGYEAHVLR
jgi:threonine dehydratase